MDSWIKTIASIAPGIAGMLGGPIAGGIATVVAKTLGVSEDELYKVNYDNPETKLKLQQLENDFALEIEKLQTQNYTIEMQDRDSARQREVAVKDAIPAILASLATIGYFGVIATFMFYDLPAPSDLKNMILMGATSNYTLVLSYYFGSSHKKPGDK